MKKLVIGILALATFSSCENKVRDLEEFMVDISEFTINDSILKDGDYVRILGSSGNLTEEHEIDFYNLVVVESEETGDTVNILVTNFYQSDLNDPRTQFLSNSSLEGKLVENFKDIQDKIKIDEIEAKSYDKVFYDSEYIQIDVRKFPAITGNLGWSISSVDN
jgi:hypothetical protein